jgi:glycine betaine/proline transport system substrate-binding protein
MKIKSLLLSAGMALAGTANANQCDTVRFADVGWTDITTTTALASVVLESIGYKATAQVLSVPITYKSLENKDIDVFLGNWMPTMDADVKPYIERGTVESIKINLEGAKYTLAVPQVAYDAGVKNFADIVKYADKFDSKIYGLESGNDGNRVIQSMIDQNAFGLKDFEVVDSSEAGMLSQVRRQVRRNKWILFLGWEPHPMNSNLELAYLEGGDDFFGPNLGGANIHTNVRTGYTTECKNVGQFLDNLVFSLPMENEVMAAILNDNTKPNVAAKAWIKKNPTILDTWLKDVTTLDGKPALAAASAVLK